MISPLRKIMSLVALLVVAGAVSVAFAPAASAATDPVYRLAGNDRIETAIAISRATYIDPGTAGAVVLATSQNFPDALAATPLAFQEQAPILMTPTASLDGRTANEIKRALPQGGTVFILGGTAALSLNTENQVKALGYRTDRLGGGTRYETAQIVAEHIDAPQAIFLATGVYYGGALILGPAAATNGGVLLLTNDGQMPSATSSFIQSHRALKRYAIGPARYADPLAEALSDDRDDATAQGVNVARKFFELAHEAGIVSDSGYPDALAAGPHAARRGMALLYTTPTVLSRPTGPYLQEQSNMLQVGYVYGGTAAVSDPVKGAVQKFISQ